MTLIEKMFGEVEECIPKTILSLVLFCRVFNQIGLKVLAVASPPRPVKTLDPEGAMVCVTRL
jgi:hypothetical protein